MKAVMEIIFAIILLVGAFNTSNAALETFRKESFEKVYKGLPSLKKFTKALTKK